VSRLEQRFHSAPNSPDRGARAWRRSSLSSATADGRQATDGSTRFSHLLLARPLLSLSSSALPLDLSSLLAQQSSLSPVTTRLSSSLHIGPHPPSSIPSRVACHLPRRLTTHLTSGRSASSSSTRPASIGRRATSPIRRRGRSRSKSPSSARRRRRPSSEASGARISSPPLSVPAAG
jgi:hypothetical protein